MGQNRDSKLPLMSNAAWIVVVMIALLMSAPLLAAWTHDPSLWFGGYVFLFWLGSVALHWQWPLRHWSWMRVSFVLLGGLSLCLGVLGELQAAVYFALALLLCVPVSKEVFRLILALFGVLWTPFWSWSAGDLFGDYFAAVSLVLAVLLSGSSLFLRFLRNERKTDRLSI